MFVNIYFKPSYINRFQMQQGIRCCLSLPPPVPACRLLLEQCPVNPESGSALRAAPHHQRHFSSSSSSLPPLLHLPQTCGHWRRAGQLRPAWLRGPGRAGVRTASRGADMETESSLGVSKTLAEEEREGGKEGCAPRAQRGARVHRPEGLRPLLGGCSGTAPRRVSYNSRKGFFSFWVGCSMCFTDVIMNGSLIIRPSRNCVGRGLTVSLGLYEPGAQPGLGTISPMIPVSCGRRMVISSGFTRLHVLLLVYRMCPGNVLEM